MPVYDVSLWDFLKYASTQIKQKDQDEEFFPLSERIEMTKRICDGLLYMNKEKGVAHRDIKLRFVFKMFRPFSRFKFSSKLTVFQILYSIKPVHRSLILSIYGKCLLQKSFAIAVF